MKSLNIFQTLVSFDGNPIADGKDKNLLLKDVIIAYITNAQAMNLTPSEQATAFEIGMLIGTAKGPSPVSLEQSQYDIIKKIVDNGKIKDESIFSLVVSQQAKKMVDAAEEVKK